MTARLVAIAGTLKGTSFPLYADQMVMGRDTSNWICVNEQSASRKHCEITRNDLGFRINDLESRNGTFVNGLPIRERELNSGDRIEFGDSVFLFLSQEEEVPAKELPNETMIALPTIRLRMEDAVYLEPEKLLASVPFATRIIRGLDVILKLTKSIPSLRKFSELYKKLLETSFSVIPAQRGSIIFIDNGNIASNFSCDSNFIETETHFNQRLKDQIARERIALISNEIQQENNVASLLAAPMLLHNVLIGILYLETNDSGVRFDEDHLQLASAIASVGGIAIESLRHFEEVKRQHHSLIEDLRMQNAIIGESKSMKEIYRLIEKVGPSDSTILILGETGSGKELVARAIHWRSSRLNKTLVAINCATLTESLLESELFGYEKGAFTGAMTQKKGKLEIADGGTLFLDEVGEMSPTIQAKLLRVLQEREFDRLGGTVPIKIDVRIIAASNKDLGNAITAGTFRSDLYYRLNVVQIEIPPLRERQEDIPLLASYFISKYAKKIGRKVQGITEEAHRYLLQYHWPGNVRELENVVERAVLIGTEQMIVPEDLPEALLDGCEIEAPQQIRYFELLRQTKRKLIQEAFVRANGNHTEAAKILGVHPTNLHRMKKTLKLR